MLFQSLLNFGKEEIIVYMTELFFLMNQKNGILRDYLLEKNHFNQTCKIFMGI